MKRYLFTATVVALAITAGATSQARESDRYYAAVESACGNDPMAACIRELERLCGKPASEACITRNQNQLDAATERDFAAIRRRMEGR